MCPTRATNGPLTLMPSVKLDLGRYVTIRPRVDGTARVLFEVPKRLRPSDWSAAIPLPVTGERRGDLNDADEVARIQADAKRLLERLWAARLGRAAPEPSRSMPELIRSWQSTQRFKDKKPKTQKGYIYHAGLISAWSASNGHKPVDRIKLEVIEAFLAHYDDRPTTRRHLKIVMSMLMDRAIQLEWRTSNPLDTVKMGAPKSKVRIWEAEDVDFYIAACKTEGQPSIAAMISALWEIGQRVTDARLFRHGAEFADGAFRFWQSKTDSWVTVRVSQRTQDLIEAARDPDSLYLFTDKATGKPWDEARLGHVFADIRAEAKGRHVVLRALRHSCVVQLARAGSDIPEIASVTGHAPASAAQILAKYLPRDNALAAKAQKRRGIAAPKAAKTVRLG
jgi:site-specific recombinase XerD